MRELEEQQNDNITVMPEKAVEAESPQNPEAKEGFGLLGEVHYEDIGNGRLKCLETGHELLLKDADSYGKSKNCRLVLIDLALQNKRAPLNSFEQSPLDRCKLICKLTGDTINKSEEHIWKHLTGRKFQNKLAQKESEKLSKGEKSENGPEPKKTRTKVKKKKKVEIGNINSDLNADADSKSESKEPDFWIPPVGSRWDYDDGRDRWEDHRRSKASWKKGEKSGSKNDIIEEGAGVAEDITISRTKRMSISVGPSNFASQKKKHKATNQLVQEIPVEDQVL